MLIAKNVNIKRNVPQLMEPGHVRTIIYDWSIS